MKTTLAIMTLFFTASCASSAKNNSPTSSIPQVSPTFTVQAPPTMPTPVPTPAYNKTSNQKQNTPAILSMNTFSDAIPKETKLYKISYRSMNQLENVYINLDCSVDTNLAKVKSSYGYTLFKQDVEHECPGAVLPEEIVEEEKKSEAVNKEQ